MVIKLVKGHDKLVKRRGRQLRGMQIDSYT